MLSFNGTYHLEHSETESRFKVAHQQNFISEVNVLRIFSQDTWRIHLQEIEENMLSHWVQTSSVFEFSATHDFHCNKIVIQQFVFPTGKLADVGPHWFGGGLPRRLETSMEISSSQTHTTPLFSLDVYQDHYALMSLAFCWTWQPHVLASGNLNIIIFFERAKWWSANELTNPPFWQHGYVPLLFPPWVFAFLRLCEIWQLTIMKRPLELFVVGDGWTTSRKLSDPSKNDQSNGTGNFDERRKRFETPGLQPKRLSMMSCLSPGLLVEIQYSP